MKNAILKCITGVILLVSSFSCKYIQINREQDLIIFTSFNKGLDDKLAIAWLSKNPVNGTTTIFHTSEPDSSAKAELQSFIDHISFKCNIIYSREELNHLAGLSNNLISLIILSPSEITSALHEKSPLLMERTGKIFVKAFPSVDQGGKLKDERYLNLKKGVFNEKRVYLIGDKCTDEISLTTFDFNYIKSGSTASLLFADTPKNTPDKIVLSDIHSLLTAVAWKHPGYFRFTREKNILVSGLDSTTVNITEPAQLKRKIVTALQNL